MSKWIEFREIGLLLISALILMIIVSPVSANELADNPSLDFSSDITDIDLDDEILDTTVENTDSIDNDQENIGKINENNYNNPNSYITSNNMLGEQDTSNALSSQYTLSDDTFSQYFNSGGTIIENALKSGDTLIIGNLTNKKMIINTPLNLIGSEDHKITDGYILVERGGANSNITGLKIINANENIYAIYLRNTENVTVKDCYIVSPNFPMPIVNSNHNNIINNTIDNPITSAHSAIVLGNSHYNNISYNRVQNGANCIYLCIYAYADHKGGESHNNIIMYNNISGAHSVFCYGIAIFGDNNTVMYNNIDNTGLGIQTTGKNNTIYFNNLTNNDRGLELSGTDLTLNNTVDGEMINGNQYHEEIDSTHKETIYVDGKTGNNNNPGTKDLPFKTIKAAANYINNKENGLYTIIIQEGTYKENDIEIKNHVKIIGNGDVTINGNKKNSILILKSYKNAYIKNINFINGWAMKNFNGGAIYSTKGNLTIENCTFKNNKALFGNGSAICGDYVTVNNCKFSSNLAANGIIWIGNQADIHNSSFTNNKVTDGEAYIITPFIFYGIMFSDIITDFAKIEIDNCVFKANQAECMVGTNGSAITNSSFINNQGSCILARLTSVDNCKFTNNSVKGEYIPGGAVIAVYSNVTNCMFKDNTANTGGAAIFAIENVTVSNCSFHNNSLYRKFRYGLQYEGSGGAIGTEDNAYLKVEDCLFVNNFANSEGGAISAFNLELINSTFINNTARHYGGAIYTDFLSVYNTKFINNSAGVAGGAIATGICEINKSSFEGNKAPEGKDIFLKYCIAISGGPEIVYKYAKIALSDDNYWGDINSKEQFLEEKRIVFGMDEIRWRVEIGDEDGDPNTNRVVENYVTVIRYLAPNGWIGSSNSNDNEGIGDGTGNGIGDGTGNGIGEGDGTGNGLGEGSGDGNGNGSGSGNGNGTGAGMGTESGIGNIIGNGTGLDNLMNDLTNNITNANGNLSENLKANSTNNPKTEIKTDAGTYSTDPNPSKAESSSSSSGSPGTSGGHLKSYELEKKVKMNLNKENIYLSILLISIFLSLLLFGFYKEKRNEEEKK